MSGFENRVRLGRSGLEVGRIGLGSSYGAPSRAYEEAFERGMNYFYWGSRRRDFMGDVIRTVAAKDRDALVVVVQSYARLGSLVRRSCERALKRLRLEHADVLLLGWYNTAPPERVVDSALELKERGLVRHLALSSHNRQLFAKLLPQGLYDVFHVRYNAVHRGAECEVFPFIEALPRAERPGIVTYTTTRWGHLVSPKRMPRGEPTPSGADCHRFSLSHPAVHVSCAGPANLAEMRDALGALDRGPMTDAELAWMSRVGDHIYGRDVTSLVRDGV